MRLHCLETFVVVVDLLHELSLQVRAQGEYAVSDGVAMRLVSGGKWRRRRRWLDEDGGTGAQGYPSLTAVMDVHPCVGQSVYASRTRQAYSARST